MFTVYFTKRRNALFKTHRNFTKLLYSWHGVYNKFYGLIYKNGAIKKSIEPLIILIWNKIVGNVDSKRQMQIEKRHKKRVRFLKSFNPISNPIRSAKQRSLSNLQTAINCFVDCSIVTRCLTMVEAIFNTVREWKFRFVKLRSFVDIDDAVHPGVLRVWKISFKVFAFP